MSTPGLIALFRIRNCCFQFKPTVQILCGFGKRLGGVNTYSTEADDAGPRIPRRFRKRLNYLKESSRITSHEEELNDEPQEFSQHQKQDPSLHGDPVTQSARPHEFKQHHEEEPGYQTYLHGDQVTLGRSQRGKHIGQLLAESNSKSELTADFPSDTDFPSDIKARKEKRIAEQTQEPIKNFDYVSELKQSKDYKRKQERHAFHPRVDPRETSIILFPGQGSQFVGMGEKLLEYPSAKRIFDQASHILKYDLLDLCLNGPKEQLNKTEYCQPAVFVTSVAAIEKLKEIDPQAIQNCVGTAGFSVGEFAALVFAQAITFEQGLKLIKVRAEAMQEASEKVSSGMMTVFYRHDSKLGLALKTSKDFCHSRLKIKNPVCDVANYLFPNCKVIAGHQVALDFIRDNGKDFGITNTKQLAVSGAFHTPLMESAKAAMKRELHNIKFERPKYRVHANYNGKQFRYRQIKLDICKQLCLTVRWEQTMHILYTRPHGLFPKTYEVGPGKQLGFMLKKINAKAYESYKNIDV